MTRSDEVNKKLGALGIISRVVSIFKESMKNAAICEVSCSIIRNLSRNAKNRDDLNSHGVLAQINEALKNHPDNHGINEHGCVCIFILCDYSTSLNADNSHGRSLLTKFGAVTTVRNAVRQHQSCKKISYYGGTILRDWHEQKMKKEPLYNEELIRIKLSTLAIKG